MEFVCWGAIFIGVFAIILLMVVGSRMNSQRVTKMITLIQNAGYKPQESESHHEYTVSVRNRSIKIIFFSTSFDAPVDVIELVCKVNNPNDFKLFLMPTGNLWKALNAASHYKKYKTTSGDEDFDKKCFVASHPPKLAAYVFRQNPQIITQILGISQRTISIEGDECKFSPNIKNEKTITSAHWQLWIEMVIDICNAIENANQKTRSA